ncbi:Phosphatidylinositol N-acetylglucosaminyltransferase subunit C [Trinorchestia longiramus]|nr:Phosphatidylinositol N-acetylglucosaminyltransferase subunit C [Trinorchestia longiramus]
MTATEDCRARPPWQRVLWKRQPYADDYIGPNFFRVTKKRLAVSPLEAFLGCRVVTHEICWCFVIVSAFHGLSGGVFQPWQVMVATAVFTVLYCCRSRPGWNMVHMAVLCVCLCGCLCGGVVQSLTASVATDTIYACTSFLLVLHIVLHHYGHHIALVNETLSHNVGVFACVCLASRLTDYWAVFAFTTAGIAVFARPAYKEDEQCCLQIRVTETLLLLSASAAAVWVCVPLLLPLLLTSVALSNLLLPLLFLRLQHHRQNIYGPWDEARIEER